MDKKTRILTEIINASFNQFIDKNDPSNDTSRLPVTTRSPKMAGAAVRPGLKKALMT